jgi:hypothetical protein
MLFQRYFLADGLPKRLCLTTLLGVKIIDGWMDYESAAPVFFLRILFVDQYRCANGIRAADRANNAGA